MMMHNNKGFIPQERELYFFSMWYTLTFDDDLQLARLIILHDRHTTTNPSFTAWHIMVIPSPIFKPTTTKNVTHIWIQFNFSCSFACFPLKSMNEGKILFKKIVTSQSLHVFQISKNNIHRHYDRHHHTDIYPFLVDISVTNNNLIN